MPAGLRRPWHRRAQLALAAMGVLALVGAAGQARAGGATSPVASAAVRNLGLATLVGPVPASQPLTVGVYLKNPNQAAEDAYAKQLYDPASANYQRLPSRRSMHGSPVLGATSRRCRQQNRSGRT